MRSERGLSTILHCLQWYKLVLPTRLCTPAVQYPIHNTHTQHMYSATTSKATIEWHPLDAATMSIIDSLHDTSCVWRRMYAHTCIYVTYRCSRCVCGSRGHTCYAQARLHFAGVSLCLYPYTSSSITSFAHLSLYYIFVTNAVCTQYTITFMTSNCLSVNGSPVSYPQVGRYSRHTRPLSRFC